LKIRRCLVSVIGAIRGTNLLKSKSSATNFHEFITLIPKLLFGNLETELKIRRCLIIVIRAIRGQKSFTLIPKLLFGNLETDVNINRYLISVIRAIRG
jgi:hypothetical protein